MDVRRSHALPAKPGKHVHVPRLRSHTPMPEHSSSVSCAVTSSDGMAAHDSPDGHTPSDVERHSERTLVSQSQQCELSLIARDARVVQAGER